MKQFHSLLKRQIKRFLGESFQIPPEWYGFITAVNDIYWESDDDRAMLERSLELSSQELIQANSEMRAVFQAIPDLFFRLDSDGTILDFKGGTVEDILLKQENLIGKRIQDIPIKVVRDKFSIGILQVLEKKKSMSTEYSLSIRNSIEYYEARFIPLLENQIIVIIRNITEQKRFQEQILQNQKIQSISTLAGGIAHDFNNILGIILGYAELLEKPGADGQKHDEAVRVIIQAANRGAALVQQVLAFARKSEVTFLPVSIPQLISELLSMMRQTFPKTIGISEEHQKDLPEILGDRIQMHQILLNLCVNARDAMPAGGQLSVMTDVVNAELIHRFHPDAPSGDYVRFRVSDTGQGMDKATLQRIYEPYFTTKRRDRGIGLGLSVVYGIVDTHHGFIDVESESGKGTTFTIYIPVPKQEKPAVATEEKVVAEVNGGSETILVIEDEHQLKNIVRVFLESEGYKVITAANGNEGLQKYLESPDGIDLTISDLGLPGMGGQEVLRRILEVRPGAKVILASGYFDPDTIKKTEEAGIHHLLRKPYTRNDVKKNVRELLDEKN